MDRGERESPLRQELEDQAESIKLREEMLVLHSKLDDCKETVLGLQKVVKKKDVQIEQLKELVQESEEIKERFESVLKDRK